MKVFGLNLTLALLWSALAGELSTVNFTVGFIFGYLFLAWLTPGEGSRRYARKLPYAISFILFYFWEVVKSNLEVAREVIRPVPRRRMGILALPLDAETDAEITLLANLITFTPGTLSIDVSRDRKTLYVHALFIDDPERDKAALKAGLERRVLELLR